MIFIKNRNFDLKWPQNWPSKIRIWASRLAIKILEAEEVLPRIATPGKALNAKPANARNGQKSLKFCKKG